MPPVNQAAMILIDIEDETVMTNSKKGGGTYDTQYGYFHEVERDGSPKRLRREVKLFPPKENGVTRAYKKGQYTMGPRSIEVEANGFMKLGFVNLVQVPPALKV